MVRILELCGYTAYQAQCLAPFLWAAAAGTLGSWLYNRTVEAANRRRWQEVQREERRRAAAEAVRQREQANREKVIDFLKNAV